MDSITVLLSAVGAGLLLLAIFLVIRFNLRMSDLWRLLESKGRGERVHELRDSALTNLPSTRYLYNDVDFDDSEIRDLKRRLKRMHWLAIASLLAFGATATATIATWL